MCPGFDCTAGWLSENIKFWVEDTNSYTVEFSHAEPPKQAYAGYQQTMSSCKIQMAGIRGVA